MVRVQGKRTSTPRNPSRLPLLFALDAKLKIENGFHYEPDCKKVRNRGDHGSAVYCGGEFSSPSVDGRLDGFESASPTFSFSFSGSDAGSGCGGSACGGCGCGGGGS